MKRIISLLILISLCITLFSCMPNLKRFAVKFADDKVKVSESIKKSDEYVGFVNNVNDFAIKLAASVNGDTDDGANFGISPVSAYMSLAIACEISDEETRQEILHALGITYEEMTSMTKYLYALCNEEYTYVDQYDETKSLGLSRLSASIWTKEGTSLKTNKVNSLTSKLMCDVYAASYKEGTAQKMINQYVEYKTHGVSNGNLKFPANTDLAIVCTYYIQEVWNSLGRNMSLTMEYHDFVNSDGSKSAMPLLRGHYEEGRMYESATFSAFYIDTANGFRMHFVIPSEDKSVSDVFTQRNISRVLNIQNYSHKDEINKELHYTRILFPEFKASFNGTLNNVLKDDFGINRLFENGAASFSSLSNDPLSYKNVLHKCDVNVSTNGFDGESVYGTGGTTPSAPEEYAKIYHDYALERSFGFIITDPNGLIVYTGVINNID